MALEANPNPLFSQNSDGSLVYGSRINQPGMQDYVSYDVESQLIRGTMSFSKDRLRELDPSYTGHTHVFVLRLPPFMTAIANGNQVEGYEPNGVEKAKSHCKNLKALLELGSTAYSGTPDLTMNTSEVNVGWSERSYPAPTYAQYDGKNFTIRCLETRGEPLRRALEYYINGVTDANLKGTGLHGALENGKLMEPTLANITFSFMVVQTDQTLRQIQDISIWNSAIITSVPRDNLDWENGSIDIVPPRDLQFTGVYMPDTDNEIVTQRAYRLLGNRMRYYRRYRDYDAKMIGAEAWSTELGSL